MQSARDILAKCQPPTLSSPSFHLQNKVQPRQSLSAYPRSPSSPRIRVTHPRPGQPETRAPASTAKACRGCSRIGEPSAPRTLDPCSASGGRPRTRWEQVKSRAVWTLTGGLSTTRVRDSSLPRRHLVARTNQALAARRSLFFGISSPISQGPGKPTLGTLSSLPSSSELI